MRSLLIALAVAAAFVTGSTAATAGLRPKDNAGPIGRIRIKGHWNSGLCVPPGVE
jgi:hypothetical protein